jgi:hypothetical protein
VTTTITPTAGPIGEPVAPPDGLADALRAAGLAHDVVRATRVGPAAIMLSRWTVETAGGGQLWVDVPGGGWRGDPALPVPPGWLVDRCAAAGDEHAEARHAVPLPGIGWAYRIPWPATVLGHSMVLAAMTGRPLPSGLSECCGAAGAFLRRLHAWPAPRQVEHRPPPPLTRLAAPPAGALVTADPRWEAVVASVRAEQGDAPAPLHGQLGLAHLLVPDPTSAPGPRICLVAWSGVVGSPAFDVGQVLGDLLEVAAVFGQGVERALPGIVAAAVALRRGYEAAGRPLPNGFWAGAARAACVKVLDHDARRIRAFGEATVSTELLGRVATALLDPDTALGAVFADPPGLPEETTP